MTAGLLERGRKACIDLSPGKADGKERSDLFFMWHQDRSSINGKQGTPGPIGKRDIAHQRGFLGRLEDDGFHGPFLKSFSTFVNVMGFLFLGNISGIFL